MEEDWMGDGTCFRALGVVRRDGTGKIKKLARLLIYLETKK